MRCLASEMVLVCSSSGSPSIPNIFFWKDPRWSKARMYSLPSYPSAMGIAPVGREVAVVPSQSRLQAMKHNFTGPSYTIGIEEELMICDGSSYDLANAIESLLEPAPVGDVKPELMES